MRFIDRIVIHCAATRITQDFTEEQVKESHIARGFRTWGYHYYIRKDGRIVTMRPIGQMGAHAIGYNAASIGICYEGGLDALGKSADTRTAAQKESLLKLLHELIPKYNIKFLSGHRNLSPDLNGDGKIDSWEWTKQCPCFDVYTEYSQEFSKYQLCYQWVE
ncbi:N-acetylmuramoyl-L-alanine amidase [Bacteroides sp. 214]|uniref:N-acetylmuramoyl-L-alanine amidase n=1 Tax=Bacteroides sp. 214 TaxID=2302935 RepID=UPI0013D579FD|nr:N-acetylmuramoyl-L-alanine amidase [Bacteroides sp. 214]NDW13179.1 N-acetylmuramoyl-L-alanine amidase [Bacteroides sp. 214]